MKQEERRDSEALYNRMTISELKTNIPEPKPTDPIQAGENRGHNHTKKTCPCNIQGFFSTVKIENFIRKKLIVLIFLLKTLIVGTRQNRRTKAVITSTYK